MSFDPDSFLNTDVSGEVSTEFTPIPIGEYPAVIEDVSAKEVVSQKTGQTYRFLEVRYAVDDAHVREVTGMDTPKTRQSISLDLTDAGTLDLAKGKNVNLGRLLEATGLNGGKWNFQMLVGRSVKAAVKHRTADDGQIYAEVKAVTKL